MTLDEIQLLRDGNPVSQGCPGHHITSWPLSQLEGKGQKSGRGIETEGRPFPRLSWLLWVQKCAFVTPWLCSSRQGLTLPWAHWDKGVSCKEHLGRTAGAGALGRACLNVKQPGRFPVSPNSCFSVRNNHRRTQSRLNRAQVAHQPQCSGLLLPDVSVDMGVIGNRKEGGKVKSVAEFPPPPHTGVQGRDGGALWMTRGFHESEEPKGWVWCRKSWINPLPPQAAPRSPSITAKGKAGIPTPGFSQMLYL